MKPFVGDHTIETILFTIGGDFSGLHPPSDKTNRFIFIGTGSGDHDADRLRRWRLFFRRWKRDGEDLDFASFPAYNSLKENLTKAKTESSGFSDIDESTTAVLKVLDEMVPLTSKMESYYTSKEYTTDGNQKGREMVASYLKLYDQFNTEYSKLDSAISQHNSELRDLLIEEMKKDNKVMAATYMEIGRDMRRALEAIDPEDPAKTDKAQIEKLLGQVKENMEKLKPAEDVSGVKSFKSSAERAIGRIRTYLAGGGGNDAFNDMVEAYNDFIRDSNRIDASELDNKKK